MKKILICDDSMTVRKKLNNLIRDLGDYDVLEAKDGRKAVSFYRSFQPDMVFMDIMMPVESGLEATEEIIGEFPEAKIVMLSSVGTKSNLKKALEVGAMDFIQKPFDKEKLSKVIDHFCGEE